MLSIDCILFRPIDLYVLRACIVLNFGADGIGIIAKFFHLLLTLVRQKTHFLQILTRWRLGDYNESRLN